MRTEKDNILNKVPWCIISNFLLLYICYAVCRAIFLAINMQYIAGDMHGMHFWWNIVKGSFIFDTATIFYCNIPYLLLVLLPLHYKETTVIKTATKWIFIIINSLSIISNLFDSVYYSYTQRRATIGLLDEFGNNTNIGSVIWAELLNSWYLVVTAVILIFFLWKCYRSSYYNFKYYFSLKYYYISRSIWLMVIGLIAVMGIRGDGFKKSSRPIAVNNAHEYVNDPSQAGIVVNTTFSLLRTVQKRKANIPEFFEDTQVLDAYFTPLHYPNDSAAVNKKNIVILIVESFAEEFIGERNKTLDNGTYKGYTVFTDSLLHHATTWEHTYCNSWVSIDAMPAVLSSIPKMYVSFILTPYGLNDIPSMAKELGDWGYHTAFFHGAENSSMGFHAFANSAGFKEYYGRTEYDADPRFDGEEDFDGTWAIWDEEFLQFFAAKMSEMPQPFLTSIFTATSHHPFAIPERYKDVYPDEGKWELHKCIRYTDNAIRQFFNTARKQPWYDNTIFVICADHASSKTTHPEYMTAIGKFRIPIIIYDPTGALPKGTQPGIAQQTDIMPTILGLLGYDKPYIAYGKDLFATNPKDTWAFNFHNLPQYIKGEYILQYDDYKPSGLYHFTTDSLMKHNLLESGNYDKEFVKQMEHEMQAILQSYETRMRADSLRVGE